MGGNKKMKRFLFVNLLVIACFIKLQAHGFGIHAAHLAKVIALNDNYTTLLTEQNGRFQPYFIYGSMFPDIQYAVNYKSALNNLYSKIRNYNYGLTIYPFDGLTYEIPTDKIPEPSAEHPPFGFDTHHETYAMQFAEYLLSNSYSIPSGVPTYGQGIDQKKRQLAFALGYYSHLSEDAACHNFLVPKITASLNLGDLQLIKNSTTFSTDPNAQMEGIIESIDDHYYGDNNIVKQTVYNDIWVYTNQYEPSFAQIFTENFYTVVYDDHVINQSDNVYNPILPFFLENVKNFLSANPTIKKNDPISTEGLYQLMTAFRFVNRFYPEAVGNGRIDEALATWISNHIDYNDVVDFEAFLLRIGSAGVFDIIYGLLRDNNIIPDFV